MPRPEGLGDRLARVDAVLLEPVDREYGSAFGTLETAPEPRTP